MKQGIVKYSEEFVHPVTGLKRWVGIEYPIDFDNEIPEEAFLKAQIMVQQGYAAMNPSYKKEYTAESIVAAIQSEPKLTKEETINTLSEKMRECTTLPKPDGLESYRTFALQYPETTELYEELHQKLNQ